MSKLTKVAPQTMSVQAEAVAKLFNEGYVRIYDGDVPDSLGTPVDDASKLLEYRMGKTAAKSISNGSIQLNSLDAVVAKRRGKPTHFVMYRADGVTPIIGGTCGKEGCNMNLKVDWIEEDALVSIPSYRHTMTNVVEE